MKSILTILLLFLSFEAFSQGRNAVWCFGDSAGIRFDQGTTQVFTSSTVTRGGSCSIADSSGNLLFYANTDYYLLWNQGYIKLGVVFDRFHNVMQNGDTLIGIAFFQEQVIVPFPDSSHLFYLFSLGIAPPYGFYYSVIDLNQNSGLGAVVQKNIQLTNYKASDCVSAIKHGNGRDWWVYFRRFDTINNEYYRYLVSPLGISGPFIQNIGTLTDNGFMHSTFSNDGSKYLIVDYRGLIEVYNVNRCTGLFSNPTTIETEQPSALFPKYTGCAFSSNNNFIYVNTTDNPTTYLYQYNLQAPNITSSKFLVDSVEAPSYFGYIRLAPDNKIYCSLNYFDGIQTYPYTDSLNNNFNQYLSVINSPDSAGTACNFTPFSFYLGGNETYWGLPNNPDYDLGPLVGSPCDTIVSIPEPQPASSNLYIYYSPQWQSAFINADKLKGRTYQLRVLDVMGREVHSEFGNLSSTYFTRNLNCEGFAKGMYLVVMETDKEKLVKKFVVE